MAENTVEKKSISGIQPLDLDNLSPWLEENITEPFVSFADKTHRNGKPFSKKEQTKASREQVKKFVEAWRESNMSDEQIKAFLTSLVSED